MNPSIAVLGWQAITPLGMGADAQRGSAAPTGNPTSQHGAAEGFPVDIEYRCADFDAAAILGAKGIRTMDRTTALAVCTSKLLHDSQPIDERPASEQVGFVIGTTTGSIRSTSDFTRDSLVQERPFLVNPALFPNTVMNCAAGQCAIRFKACSVNATISGGRLSGLLALKYASQMLRRGYAQRLFTGSVEELCAQTAWAHRELVRHGSRHDVPLGEGSAMFALERADTARERAAHPVAEIVALHHGRWFDPDTDSESTALQGVVSGIGEALLDASLSPGVIAAAVLCGAADVVSSRLEHAAAAAVLAPGTTVHGRQWVERLDDTYSASVSLAPAHLLGELQPGQNGLILIVGADGHAGCVIVRVPDIHTR